MEIDSGQLRSFFFLNRFCILGPESVSGIDSGYGIGSEIGIDFGIEIDSGTYAPDCYVLASKCYVLITSKTKFTSKRSILMEIPRLISLLISIQELNPISELIPFVGSILIP